MTENSVAGYRRVVQAATAGLCVLFCLYCLWAAGRAGFSRLLSASAANPVRHSLLNYGQPDAADSAIRLTPSDPEAHLVRAVLLQADGKLDGAILEYERAAALRPRDYVLWLELGLARDQAQDVDGAANALKNATRLAPFYAEPRWQLGNFLLRAGRPDEAFIEMRSAVESNPALLPQLIGLAWVAFDGDVRSAEQAIQPRAPASRLAWARFLAKRGKGEEAISIYRTVPEISDDDRRLLVDQLLAVRQFEQAYEVWSRGESKRPPGDGFTDPGFEGQIKLDESGFGWRVAGDLQTLQVSADPERPYQGAVALRLDWHGGPPAASHVVSQLVLVEPNARYRLRFAARSEQLVSGGPPILTVTEGVDEARRLAESAPLPLDTSGWQVYALDFAAGNDTRAVSVALRRQGCSGGPCPIFGRLWLDDFSLLKR
jgi:tetratricopeptide (TPR) repeat protein